MLLRLLAFQSTDPAVVVDEYVRQELEPALLQQPGITWLYVARGAEPVLERRHIVSVWDAARGADPGRLGQLLQGEQSEHAIYPAVTLLPLALALDFAPAERPAIVRVFRGRTHPGDLEPYIEEARNGTFADAALEHGPAALFLGTAPPDEFVTVSVWSDWERVARATGGNLRAPIATRHTHRLVTWTAAHYELVPGTLAGRVGEQPTGSPAEAEEPSGAIDLLDRQSLSTATDAASS